MVAMGDGRIEPDDPAGQLRAAVAGRPERQGRSRSGTWLPTPPGSRTPRRADCPHDRLTGWKGDFWKRLPPPHDPFTLARDRAPVLDVPARGSGTATPAWRCSATASRRASGARDDTDLRSLLKRRIMGPLGVPDAEWSVGYGTTTTVDGLPLVATWGGGSYSPNAVARVGRLLLHRGGLGRHAAARPDRRGDGHSSHSGMPGHSGLGWWVNTGRTGPGSGGPPPRMRSGVPGPATNSSWSSPAWT